MAKTSSKGTSASDSMLAGGTGVQARKAIAGTGYNMAGSGGPSFGVESFEKGNRSGGAHPDHTAGTGGKELGDDMRKGHVAGGRDSHPAQAAPDHGPHHASGYQSYGRG